MNAAKMIVETSYYNGNGIEPSEILQKCLSSTKDNLIGFNAGTKLDCWIIFIPWWVIINPYEIRNLFRKVLEKSNQEPIRQQLPVVFTTILPEADIVRKVIPYFKLTDNEDPKRFFRTYFRSHSPFTTSLFSPNIWFRFIDWAELTSDAKSVMSELSSQISSKLFEQTNTVEYRDIFIRTQLENYLNSPSGGHSKHIYPNIYTDESFCRQLTQIPQELYFLFDTSKHDGEDTNIKNKAYFRVLLVDDKPEKVEYIKKLISLEDYKDLREKVVWMTSDSEKTIEVLPQNYQTKEDIPTSEICQQILKATNNTKPNLSPHIQLVYVKSLRDARELLSTDLEIRFDLILLDYLLKKKEDKFNSRELATDFWVENNIYYFSSSEKETDESRYNADKVLYQKIKENRGPLKKLWIFPISAFNQTFLDCLKNKGISLIDYYWYLSNGADPLNTPLLFILYLNKFISLQLKYSVYSKNELLNFLSITINQIKKISNKHDDFIAFMGAEYSSFMNLYNKQQMIYRDMTSGSLLANFVWHNFYRLKSPQPSANVESQLKYTFQREIQLNNCLREFYHAAAESSVSGFRNTQKKLERLEMEIRAFHKEWLNQNNLSKLKKVIGKLNSTSHYAL